MNPNYIPSKQVLNSYAVLNYIYWKTRQKGLLFTWSYLKQKVIIIINLRTHFQMLSDTEIKCGLNLQN